ncbi:MAG: nucleotidyltransferase domain-containing protein [Anaerolineae bacterium]|nr:nucleotidyltransferase domain-containing protein [Anaerolineae bacterium]
MDEEILKGIIRRIVEVAQPEKIILFGSAARGGLGPNSDVDLLVVKGGDFNYYTLLGDIYLSFHGLGHAADVVLVTPAQVEQYRDTHCLVIAPALGEGKEVYRAPTPFSGEPLSRVGSACPT